MKKLLFLLGIICFTPTVSLAEDKVYKDTSYLILYNFSWDTVIHIARTARKKFVGAKLSTGEIIEKETPAQLAKPIVNFETVSIMVDVGALSVTAEWCGLDWQNNYLLSMQGLRATKLFTESQMAYFELCRRRTK